MPTFRTSSTFKTLIPSDRYEISYFDDESCTVPGQSYSIQEILRKFTNGTMPMVGKSVYYDGDPDFEDFDPTLSPDYDLVDAVEALAALSANLRGKHKEDLPDIPDSDDAPPSPPGVDSPEGV